MPYSPVQAAADANKALLKLSQDRTTAMREKREQAKREAEREAQGAQLAKQMGGWSESAMGELIEIYKGLES